MTHDYLYYWEKLGPGGEKKLLGEVQIGQNGYNMSFVIDGTKDSAKLVVISYTITNVIKPYTVCWHENTDTWWIVANDKVEKVINDNGTFIYIHNLQLEGAIELLNARDLTDCGFYQNTYTISQFAYRLFELSNFELRDENINIMFGSFLSSSKKVDYIKTYENYTLLSALVDFFGGYNCTVKMYFLEYALSPNYIYGCGIEILPKTGNFTRPTKSIDTTFNDIKEIKTLNKNSYGTTVITNAESIVSTKYKIYPNVGFARISSENYKITPEEGVIRLPSKVKSVQYVDMMKGKIKVAIGRNQGNVGNYTNPWSTTNYFDSSDVSSFNDVIDWIRTTLSANTQPSHTWVEENTDDEFWNAAKGQSALDTFNENIVCRLYDVYEYDPLANRFVSDNTINYFYKNIIGNKPYVLASKDIRNGVREPKSVMYWERGSNLIRGFDFFDWQGVGNIITSYTKTGIVFIQFDVTEYGVTYHYKIVFGDSSTNNSLAGYISLSQMQYSLLDTYFRVKYIPMSDLKMKYDNSGYGKDIQLYNQNGKLTDGVALSKLLLSYKKEIESDNITRYAIGYLFSSMPKAGDIISNGNDLYVINNVSLDFFQNEELGSMGYFIVGEFTLSRNVATKSLLTNPNTNIRDYGIPQNYNVRRKQLYRDFYEIGFTKDTQSDNDIYLDLTKVFNMTMFATSEYEGHTAIMELSYSSSWGGGGSTYEGGTVPPSNKWYFQIESTIYFTKKAMYEVVDFQDNNILGYDSQNVTCGFDIRRIFEVIQVGNDNIDIINTPISYVDSKGKVLGIDINMCSSAQTKEIYDTYKQEMETQYQEVYNGVLYNRCVFIPQDIYDMAEENHDYKLIELGYNKDALEVPVFEYCCEIDDSDNVLIGENIFETQEDDNRYIYECIKVNHNLWDDNNWNIYFTPKDISISSGTLTLDDSNVTTRKVLTLTKNDDEITLNAFDSVNVESVAETFETQGQVNMHNWLLQNTDDVDLAIVKYVISKNPTISNGKISNPRVELVMVIKNAKECPYTSNSLNLVINHYKLS